MGSKPDIYYIEKVLSEIKTIIKYTKDLKFEDFVNDEKTIDATMFRLQQMVEHIKDISISFKEKYNEMPWPNIVGFRNKIVHEYGTTNYLTVYEIVSSDIYKLQSFFENIINKGELI